jgi:hypothetical protein
MKTVLRCIDSLAMAAALLLTAMPMIGAQQTTPMGVTKRAEVRTAPLPRHNPVLTGVASRLQSLLKRDCPQATLTWEDDHLISRFHTRKFMVYSVGMDGGISKRLVEEIGPEADGYSLDVSVERGKYAGQAVVPQDLREPYWTTFVDADAYNASGDHLKVTLSYGVRTNRSLLHQIKAVIAEVCRAQAR